MLSPSFLKADIQRRRLLSTKAAPETVRDSNVIFSPKPIEGWLSPLLLIADAIKRRSYRELFKGPGMVYEWIWANLVRSEWIDTKGYPIKEKYYDKGLLAYCSPPGKIGKECGMSKNTVKKYIDEFEKAGIIKVEYLIPRDGKRGQSVFILGTWKEVNGKIVERYYRDEIFLSEKSVQKLTD